MAVHPPKSNRGGSNLPAAAVAPEAVGYTVAATLTGLSVRTLKRRVAAGQVPGVIRHGGRLLFGVRLLREWVAEGMPLRGPSVGRRRPRS